MYSDALRLLPPEDARRGVAAAEEAQGRHAARRRPQPAAGDEAAPREPEGARRHRRGSRASAASQTRGKTLWIGATTTHADVAASPLSAKSCPVLAEAAAQIGDIQVRNRGTIGGSIAHADPAADFPTVLVALGATVVAKGPKGERKIPAEKFFMDLFTTALKPGEIVTAVLVPPYGKGTGGAYLKHRAPGLALRGGRAWRRSVEIAGRQVRRARASWSAARRSNPVRAAAAEAALVGPEPDAAAIAKAAAKVAEAIADPLGDTTPPASSASTSRRSWPDVPSRRPSSARGAERGLAVAPLARAPRRGNSLSTRSTRSHAALRASAVLRGPRAWRPRSFCRCKLGRPAVPRGRGRRGQDRGREGPRRRPRHRADPPPVLRGARRPPRRLRVELRAADDAHPPRSSRAARRRARDGALRPGVPPAPAAPPGDRAGADEGAGAARRRDRPQRRGVRGVPARGALGLPDHDPRDRHDPRGRTRRSSSSPPTARARCTTR